MKFSLMLILPCFLTLGTASLVPFVAMDGTAAPTTEHQSIIADASETREEAHRGSGRFETVA
ncbi:MAG: hypothetical protein F6K09_06390 [Merismopedia sp. SIO2A8]|nr:hypothetical protein [Symploca sp. SIO2B6]NET48347.1 hypothetical protein [Merismopedia sp. SIO2A8]